jgi:RHS repeat-associated protein
VSHSIAYAYDALNRLTNMVYAAGTTTYSYTSAGDLQTETAPFTSDTVTYTYHSSVPHLRMGLTLQQPSGNWSKVYGYDAGDRLKAITSPAGTFVYTYNGAGSQIGSVNVPNATYYTNYYDSVGRQYWTTLYTSGGTSLAYSGYTYNQAGQRSKVWRAPDNIYDTITYDNYGQVQSCVGSGGYSTEQLGYLYDAARNLNQRTNASVVIAFGVNNLNQLTSEPNGTPTYDSNGNITSESSGRTFAYDDENELTSVSSGTSYRSDFVYDGLGRRRKELDYTWNSGWTLSSQTWFLYDGRTVIQERDGNNNVVVSYTRGSDLSGSLQGAGGIGGLLARTAGASSGALVTSVTTGGSLRSDFSGWVGLYFVVGNTPLTVSGLGRWVVAGNASSHGVALFTAAGNQISGGSVTVSTAGVPSGQFAYATLATPVTLAANTGYCLMTQETSGGDQWYDYNGTSITLNGDASGSLSVYAYNTVPPVYVAPSSSGESYGPVNLQYSKASNFSHSYYHADGNGNVRVVMSSAQGYQGSYLYDPYGNVTYTYDVLSPPNTYRFASKELHANSGLYYYGFRFYDPNLQRWLNRDPIEEEGGINLYQFCGNDPIDYFDPLGLDRPAPGFYGVPFKPTPIDWSSPLGPVGDVAMAVIPGPEEILAGRFLVQFCKKYPQLCKGLVEKAIKCLEKDRRKKLPDTTTVEDLTQKELGIKQSWPGQPANRTRTNLRKRLGEEAGE